MFHFQCLVFSFFMEDLEIWKGRRKKREKVGDNRDGAYTRAMIQIQVNYQVGLPALQSWAPSQLWQHHST